MSKESAKQPTPGSYALFAKRTTFHGFRELRDSTTWWEKGLWIAVLLACTAMLILHTCIQMDKFLTGQTGTRVSKLNNKAHRVFPPVWIEAIDWSFVDVAKLKRFGITPEEMRAAIGYSSPDKGYNSSIPVEEAKKSLKEKMQKMGIKEILQFYDAVAQDTYDGAQPAEVVVKKAYGGSIYFYLLNTSGAVQMPFAQAWAIYVGFNFSAYWRNMKEFSDFLNLGYSDADIKAKYKPALFNIDTYQSVGIVPDYSYNLNTDCQIYRQMGGCTDKYTIEDLYFLKPCQLECELKANASLNAKSCILYSESFSAALELTESWIGKNLTLCHRGILNDFNVQIEGAEEPVYRPLTLAEVQQHHTEVSACQKRCVPRCDQWRTTWSVSSTDNGGLTPDSSLIQVIFPDPENLVIIEEVQQYEWHDLVSDLGGLLGLWLGASMMSLFQLFHLCFLSRLRHRVNQVSSTKQMQAKPIVVGVGVGHFNIYDATY